VNFYAQLYIVVDNQSNGVAAKKIEKEEPQECSMNNLAYSPVYHSFE
jgi:hypothetical protein